MRDVKWEIIPMSWTLTANTLEYLLFALHAFLVEKVLMHEDYTVTIVSNKGVIFIAHIEWKQLMPVAEAKNG